VELTILSSAYHQEINAADAGNADRFVIQDVIKEIAQSYNPANMGQGHK
jgi:replication factor C subunit 3/5